MRARAFVRKGVEVGATYYTFTPLATLGGSLTGGRLRPTLPGVDELLRAKGLVADEPLPYLWSAGAEFDGDERRAYRWAQEMFEESPRRDFLRRQWQRLLSRARQLDAASKEDDCG